MAPPRKGGVGDLGTVFKIAPDGTTTTLAGLGQIAGTSPRYTLMQAKKRQHLWHDSPEHLQAEL